MTNVFVFSQNFNLNFFETVLRGIFPADRTICLTTNHLFCYERDIINKSLPDAIFISFADFFTDDEMASIDKDAYSGGRQNLEGYINTIRREKNLFVLNKLKKNYSDIKGFLLSADNDLGIFDNVWITAGFKKQKGKYYYNARRKTNKIKAFIKRIPCVYKCYKYVCDKIFQKLNLSEDDVHVFEKEGFKYIIIGKLNRIDYRLNIQLKQSKSEFKKLQNKQYYKKGDAQYLVPWHEHSKCPVPDCEQYDVWWCQDGYLPSNYSDYTYHFKPHNVSYYAWDLLGTELFKKQKLLVSLLPFRKKIFLPKPNFPKEVKQILVATSASGDWTAQKNRSDDDFLVEFFVEVAKRFPNIKVVYRCHPNWISPNLLGCNSIERVRKYFSELKLNNLILSTNITSAFDDGGFSHTLKRASLNEDLKNSDIVFGEHSVSMIDAGLKGIVFCSVNSTKRRSFFQSMINLGFPSCNSVEEICSFISNCVVYGDVQKNYLDAISRYNTMTESEFPNE